MTVFETREPGLCDYVDKYSLLIIILSAIAAVWLWKNLVIPSWTDATEKILVKIVFSLLAIFPTCLCLLLLYSGVDYGIYLRQNYEAYITGECYVVEGYVEAFHPMPEELHNTEHFTVCGKYFFYSADNSPLYYSRCKKDGGYITGDGIKVKIWYLSPEKIMRLDILEE